MPPLRAVGRRADLAVVGGHAGRVDQHVALANHGPRTDGCGYRLTARTCAMTENVENLLLEHLKALRNELREFRNEFHSETENLKQRMSALETAMINVKREVNAGDETDARHQVQIDQLVERIRRIEKRLDLT
jgi:hypothetical protein